MDPAALKDLVWVRLTAEQISLVEQANGPRLKITHALLCGSYGQMFGTEKQCTKYYEAWKHIFRHLFREAYRAEAHSIRCYESTFDLVMSLIAEDDRIQALSKVRR
jgi:hypothetical protein